MTLFNKTDDNNYLIVPQPHFGIIYDALHVVKLCRDSVEFNNLCDEYPQLREPYVTGKVAISFEHINTPYITKL